MVETEPKELGLGIYVWKFLESCPTWSFLNFVAVVHFEFGR